MWFPFLQRFGEVGLCYVKLVNSFGGVSRGAEVSLDVVFSLGGRGGCGMDCGLDLG